MCAVASVIYPVPLLEPVPPHIPPCSFVNMLFTIMSLIPLHVSTERKDSAKAVMSQQWGSGFQSQSTPLRDVSRARRDSLSQDELHVRPFESSARPLLDCCFPVKRNVRFFTSGAVNRAQSSVLSSEPTTSIIREAQFSLVYRGKTFLFGCV